MFPSTLATETLEFVVKVTKYCNLRCRYCYEFPHLNDKTRMSEHSLKLFFENARDHVQKYGQKRLSFCWHGGEPLMLPLDYWHRVSEISRQVFRPIENRCKIVHIVQTNLTILSDKHLDFLSSGSFFDYIGISFDGFGGQRLSVSGKDSTDQVARNIQRLLDAEVSFGAISVVTAQSLPWMAALYEFFDSLGIKWRMLPFYMSASGTQLQEHAVSEAEIIQLYKAVFDRWLQSPTATSVDPIDEYIEYAVHALAGERRQMFDAKSDECVFIVDTDGQLWSTAEAYDPGCSYGNIFDEPLERILSSVARETRCRRSTERIKKYCGTCSHRGFCPGAYVGEATHQQIEGLTRHGCPVAPVLDYMVARLRPLSSSQCTRDDLTSPQETG